jgi:tRNA1Val (adenine37-N6)-methyltransferase
MTDPMTEAEPDGWPDDAQAVRNVGGWLVWQRRRGHRTSTDDMIAAYMAVRQCAGRRPGTYVDLGCGIGSVLFAVAYTLRPEQSVGVEAQAQSVLLARRTVDDLPIDAPSIAVEHADLRTWRPAQPVELITGSPPYFPVGAGVLSPDPQRRACRFELRGGVEAYCETAATALRTDGSLHLVFPTAGNDRVEAAIRAAGLHTTARLDVRTRSTDAAPFLSGYSCTPSGVASPPRVETIAVRDAQGEVTPAWNEVRRVLGYAVGA